MNKDQVKGSAKKATGRVQEAVGRLTGKTGQQLKGQAKQVTGTTQKAFGDAKENIKHPK